MIVADADAFFRDESPADLFRTRFDFEEFRAIDGATGGFDFVEKERNRRVVVEDVVEFRLALFRCHNFSYSWSSSPLLKRLYDDMYDVTKEFLPKLFERILFRVLNPISLSLQQRINGHKIHINPREGVVYYATTNTQSDKTQLKRCSLVLVAKLRGEAPHLSSSSSSRSFSFTEIMETKMSSLR